MATVRVSLQLVDHVRRMCLLHAPHANPIALLAAVVRALELRPTMPLYSAIAAPIAFPLFLFRQVPHPPRIDRPLTYTASAPAEQIIALLDLPFIDNIIVRKIGLFALGAAVLRILPRASSAAVLARFFLRLAKLSVAGFALFTLAFVWLSGL